MLLLGNYCPNNVLKNLGKEREMLNKQLLSNDLYNFNSSYVEHITSEELSEFFDFLLPTLVRVCGFSRIVLKKK